MRPELHLEVEIARRSTAGRGLPLPRQAQELAWPDSLRDRNIENPFAHAHVAVLIPLRRMDRDLAARTGKGILQVDLDRRVVILAARCEARWTATRSRASVQASEKRFEE